MINQFSNVLNRNFVFCDVGARWGLEEPWKSYHKHIDTVSFEPDREAYEELKKWKTDRNIVLPYALYKEEKLLNLQLTKSRGCSSIYHPNQSYLERFPDVERFTVEKKEVIESTTLDTLYGNKVIQNMDFIKIDTQGTELDILRGGVKIFDEIILGAQVEVEFKPLYTSQPLFNDVDRFICDKLGLVLFDIRKTYWKYNEGRGIGPSKGQLIFGDALYFRDPYELPKWCEQFGDEEARNKIIMACFMGIIYGYPDYSLCLLERPEISLLLKTETIAQLKKAAIASGWCNKLSFKGSKKLWHIFYLISKIFEPEHEGWANGEQHLGSRKKFGIYY